VKPKRPKKLYRFDVNHRINCHDLADHCTPELEPNPLRLNKPDLWRCRHRHDERNNHDFYGYAKRADAKADEIENIRREIISLGIRLKELTGDK
jgi:hypothetical protein